MGIKYAQALLAALISSPLAAQTYSPTLIAPQILGSPQGAIALNLGDDNTRTVNLGFSFDYFGSVYTSAVVSSNGFVSFQNTGHLCCDGQPMTNAPRNTIYAYWTDLISGPNPYYKPIEGGILFGWYNTNEYGTQNKNTFEIALYANGNIQIDYGAVANSYHHVAAGLTGPTTSDNIQLFYGTNVQSLNNQSGMFIVGQPKVEEVLAPVSVAPTPTVVAAPNPVAASPVETMQTQVSAVETQTTTVSTVTTPTTTISDPVVEATTQVAVAETTTAQTTQATQETTQTTTTQETAQAAATQQTTIQETKEEVKEAALPPGGIPGVPTLPGVSVAQTNKVAASETSQPGEAKKDRVKEAYNSEAISDSSTYKFETVLVIETAQVATVAQADAQYEQRNGEQRTTETVEATYSFEPLSGNTFGQVAAATPTPTLMASSDPTSTTSQTQQLTLLDMGNMQNEMSSGEPKDIGDVNTADAETMAQLAVVPVGYSSYTQARIPDMPFYQPKDIYKGRRIPDANMVLYRLMRGQDSRWQDMVDEQYE